MNGKTHNFLLSRRQLLQGSALLFGALLLPSCTVTRDGRINEKTREKPLPLYAMALMPPPDISAVCADVRRQFDPERSDKTFPHITLKQPFMFPDDAAAHEKALLLATQRVCSHHAALTVQLGEISSFDSPVHGSVVHVQVTLSSSLHRLQQALTEAVAAIGGITTHLTPALETRVYYPHLTLAQGLSHAAAAAAMAGENIPAFNQQQFVAHQVVVGRCGEDQVWQQIGHFPLAAIHE